MTKDEALNLALEALEIRCGTNAEERGPYGAITAIREALAQPEQEPVAWITKNGKGWLRWHRPEDNEKNKDSIPLYTTPPHRKPLSDEEIWKFWWSRPEVPEGEDDSMEAEFVTAVRRVLAAHGIKE